MTNYYEINKAALELGDLEKLQLARDLMQKALDGSDGLGVGYRLGEIAIAVRWDRKGDLSEALRSSYLSGNIKYLVQGYLK